MPVSRPARSVWPRVARGADRFPIVVHSHRAWPPAFPTHRRLAERPPVLVLERPATSVDVALASDAAGTVLGYERARAASWPRIVGEIEILVAHAVQDRRRAARSDSADGARAD